jgi:hypothetical protein
MSSLIHGERIMIRVLIPQKAAHIPNMLILSRACVTC